MQGEVGGALGRSGSQSSLLVSSIYNERPCLKNSEVQSNRGGTPIAVFRMRAYQHTCTHTFAHRNGFMLVCVCVPTI